MNEPGLPDRNIRILACVVTTVAVVGFFVSGALMDAWMKNSARERQWEVKEVAVGTRDLPAGTVLTGRDVRVGKMPFASETMVLAAERSRLVGKTLLAPLARGEPVDRNHLVPVSPVSQACVESLRGMSRSLGVANEASVSRFLNHIDPRRAW